MRKINILHLCEHFGSTPQNIHGVSRSFMVHIPRFDKDKYQITVCSRKWRESNADILERAGIELEFLGKGKFHPVNLIRLLKIINKRDIDILHCHGWGACTWGRIAGIMKKIPVIVHERGFYPKWPLYQRPIEYLLAPFTAYSLAVSKQVKDFVSEQRKINPDIIEVLYNGTELDKFKRADPLTVAKEKEKWGIDKNAKVIGTVARLSEEKRLDLIIDAMLSVRNELPDLYCVIVGEGNTHELLRDTMEGHDISDRIIFTGHSNNIALLMSMFDVHVFSSYREGTPNTLYETCAVGNAVISTPVGGIPELLTEGETALFYPFGDSKALAKNLIRCFNTPGLLQKLRKNAKEKSKEFDCNKAVYRMQEIYYMLMEENSNGHLN